MSSLGFQWVLSLLRESGFSAERVFLPDDVRDAQRRKTGLVSYETRTPLSRFPVIGISVAYELELAGVVQALELAGIPPLKRDRQPADPKIIIGGPLTFSNPLPASIFADAMLLGEADDVVVPAFGAALEEDRQTWLDTIESLPGGFVPERAGTQMPPIAKASDLSLPARGPILAPEAELSDMFLIEGERGCHRSCSFCVMRRSTNGGMRLVTPDRILDLIPQEATRVGLVGAAISDHPHLVGLLEQLVNNGMGVGISSLRADRVARKPEIARLLRAGGYKTLTVASDAASQRLRKEISKGTLEKHLISCAKQAHENRYRVLKIYMMVGVPNETEEDIEELIRFTLELSKIHPVALGIAPFVPKRNTPLDVAPFAGIKTVEKRLKHTQRGLRHRVDIRPTSAKWAWVEYMLAQSGPEGGEAVMDAVHSGGTFADYKRALSRLVTTQMAPWRKKTTDNSLPIMLKV